MTDTILITPEIDAMIDTIEEAGASWHVIGGSQAVSPYLAFKIPTMDKYSDQAGRAMEDFQLEFTANAEVRRATIDFAITVGAYYVELGNSGPYISDGLTVQ